MNVLIIGSEGFIGSHCVEYYLEQGHSVTGVDICSKENITYPYFFHEQGNGYDTVFQDVEFDVCINASGNGSVPFSFENPLADYTANCSELFSLLQAIQKFNKSCKIIHLSSAAVYGTPEQLPVKEHYHTKPQSPYGWNKLISEHICIEFVRIYQLQIAITRPFSVFGPGLRKQLFWDIFERSKHNYNIELWGTGNESRDFIFIDDLIKAFDLLLKHAPMQGEIYNLATGEEVSIRTVATLYCNMINSDIKVAFNKNARIGDPLNWKADINKLTQLGFLPETTLENGLKKTVEWIMKQ